MTHRTRRTLLILLIFSLAAIVVSGLTWIVWYDVNRGHVPQTIDGAGSPDQPWDNSGRDVQADLDRAGRNVRASGFLGTTIARYYRRARQYPTKLEDLIERPPELPAGSWDGPYFSSPDVLKDPWGNTYRYRCPGQNNPSGYDLWSKGPDEVDGTLDDVGNW